MLCLTLDGFKDLDVDFGGSIKETPAVSEVPAGFFLVPVSLSEPMGHYIMLPLLSEGGQLSCGEA